MTEPPTTTGRAAAHPRSRVRAWLLAALLLQPLLLAVGPVPADPPLPVVLPESSWRSLYDSTDSRLQNSLARALHRHGNWDRLIRQKKLAVGLVDLSDPAHPRFARLNGDTMMYAASLPKIAILLTAYEAFDEGTLPETAETHRDLADMIRVSNNAAATAMIDRLSFERIARAVTDPQYSLYDPRHGGGLWVGKRYAKEGRRYPEPMLGLSHAATVTQVCRFYYLLATGRILSPERSRQMLADLSNPGLHHKFVGAIEQRAPEARLFRKSGTWRIWHSDSVLVWGPEWRRYILAAMVESPDGERILRELVPVAEDLLQPPFGTPAG